jgi:hypothetical protein
VFSTPTRSYTGFVQPDPVIESVEVARIGEELGGRYEVLGYINQGGFATVWEARDRVAGLPVAVKRLNSHPKRAGAFYRELRAMFRLAHPHIVRLVNFLETEGSRYLIMELCRGGSLRAALSRANRKRQACPKERAAAIIGQVAQGLAAAHGEGFSHRDIKPENILFSAATDEHFGGRGFAKLADFGLASLLRPVEDDDALRPITGSPTYMAPEQFQGSFEPASDVYALGVVAYELLLGLPPFMGPPGGLALKHLHEPPEFRRPLPSPWCELLPRMLAKKPSDRPAASEVAALLEPPILAPAARPVEPLPGEWRFEHELSTPVRQLQTLTGRCRFLAITAAGFCVLQGEVREFEAPLAGIDQAHESPDGLTLILKSGRVYEWTPGGGLLLAGFAPHAARLHSMGGGERVSFSHDGSRVECRRESGGEPVWSREVNSGGLKPMLALSSDGQLAAVEFESGSGLRFLHRDGRDSGRWPLPGLCWQLHASGRDAFAARVLTGRGFAAYHCRPGGCTRYPGSGGVGLFAADPHGPACAGVWPDGTVKWWANERAEPKPLPERCEFQGAPCLAVSGRHLAFGDSSGTVRLEKVARRLTGSREP